jgi:hypothetical protein
MKNNIKRSALKLVKLIEKEEKYLKAKKKDPATKVPNLTPKEQKLKAELKKDVILYFLDAK